MFKPKVSIIIPVYNWSNYLAEAIESALDQTYNNIEILVINDGSNDNWETEKVALSFGDKINYIYKENGWVATALNLWIEKASWEYISWLSHDDLYYPNKIEEQVKVLEWLEDKNTIIYSNFEFFTKTNNLVKKWNNTCDMREQTLLYNCIMRKFPIQWCALLIKRDFFYDVWFFDDRYKCAQDYDLWFKFFSKKIKFKYIDLILVKYRSHTEQWSKKLFDHCLKDDKKIYNFIYILRLFKLNYLLEKSPHKNKYILLYYMFKSFYIVNLIIFLKKMSEKLWIYSFLSPIWRKYILKQK